MKIVLTGGLDSALTHFAMIGLAEILREAGASSIRLWWQDSAKAKPTVSWDGPDAADAVLAHARRQASQDSWVQAKISFITKKKGSYGLFSPRLKIPQETADIQRFADHRNHYLDSGLTLLDYLMISNLGEPGYWHPDYQKDHNSASRWEMKTSNGGREFIGGHLSKLADEVSERDRDSIEAGLTGRELSDTFVKNKSVPRTAAGLTPPGPVDNALAWCGLWGISGFTLIPSTGKQIGATAGASPQQVKHPKHLLIPITGEPISPSAWRALMASRAVIDIVSTEESSKITAMDYLKARGVLGICKFPVFTTNVNNPEQMILNGIFDPLSRINDDLI